MPFSGRITQYLFECLSVSVTTSWTSLTTEIQETAEPCDAFGFSHKQTELFLIRIYCCKKCWANNSAESSCLSTGRDSHKFLVKSQNGLPNLFLWNFLRRGGETKGKQPSLHYTAAPPTVRNLLPPVLVHSHHSEVRSPSESCTLSYR